MRRKLARCAMIMLVSVTISLYVCRCKGGQVAVSVDTERHGQYLAHERRKHYDPWCPTRCPPRATKSRQLTTRPITPSLYHRPPRTDDQLTIRSLRFLSAQPRSGARSGRRVEVLV